MLRCAGFLGIGSILLSGKSALKVPSGEQAVRGTAHRAKCAHLLSSWLELLTLQGYQVTGPQEGLKVMDGKRYEAGTAAGEVCSEARQPGRADHSFPSVAALEVRLV